MSLLKKRFLLIFGIFLCANLFADDNTINHPWSTVSTNKVEEINIYWHVSAPFIFLNEEGNLTGIEFEIMQSFKQYLKSIYNIDLTLNWIETEKFSDIIKEVSSADQLNTFGTSAFSITPERLKEVSFSPPYMPDISVMISSKDVPIVNNVKDFTQLFSTFTAVTIQGTSYEEDLINIRETWGLNFNIDYIPSTENILKSIAKRENVFGFIDLPVYLIEFSRNTSLNVKRQNLFPVKRPGYSIILQKDSDWNSIIEEFFLSSIFREQIRKIIATYIDYEVFTFLEDLFKYADDDVILLTKEKEIQQKELLEKSKQIQQEAQLRNFLIVAVIVIIISLVIIIRLYSKRYKAMRLLELQRTQISAQQLDLDKKTRSLEQKNKNLTELNDEKNKLIKILAHDMRTPINQVSGLAQLYLIENKALNSDQSYLINEIISAAKRLNDMISKILDVDALESKRVNMIKKPLDTVNICKKTMDSFQKIAKEKSISLLFESELKSCEIMADSMYFTQVIENLISNAIKFSLKEKEVKLTIEQKGNRCIISVIDQGPGLTEADKKMIFVKFQKLSAKPTAGEQSTGLGLSIVKKYTEMLGGEVDYHSETGQGATFFLAFPVVE